MKITYENTNFLYERIKELQNHFILVKKISFKSFFFCWYFGCPDAKTNEMSFQTDIICTSKKYISFLKEMNINKISVAYKL